MTDKSGSWLSGIWGKLKKPSAKYSLIALLSVGFVSGILFWGGFHTGLEMTNTLEFCVSCHEMRDTVYQEYKTSIHYSNRSGVRAICSDCHVPKDWGHKMLRKAKASFEVWGKLTGSIDTPEKFEAKRITLAGHEWERMKASDSRECRNCHNFDAMSDEYQKKSNYARHMKAKDAGKTCIDCHKGIAHQLPKEYEEPDED
jgi:cytochrome c-type protein NapC